MVFSLATNLSDNIGTDCYFAKSTITQLNASTYYNIYFNFSTCVPIPGLHAYDYQAGPNYYLSFDVIVHESECYEIKAVPNIVDHDQTASIVVNNLELPYMYNRELSFIQNDEGQMYGTFIGPNEISYKQLTNVLYDINGSSDQVKYKADGNIPDTSYQTTISVYEGEVYYGNCTLSIKKHSALFEVTFAPDTIEYSETATMTVQEKDANNDNIDPPDDTLLLFELDSIGSCLGHLVDYDTNGVTYAFAKAGGVKFVADGEEPDDIETVTIKVKEKDELGVEGEGSLVVKSTLDHFMVTISPDTVAHSDTVNVLILPKTINDETILIPNTTLLDIALDNNGKLYGTLLAGDGSMNKSLKGVSFSYLKDKQLKYIADGKNPINCCPPLINLDVELSRDTTISGMDSAWVKCKIDVGRYPQGSGTSWGNDVYDHKTGTRNTIAYKGCALCCQAMLMTAFGDTINPGELNIWMKGKTKDDFESGGFDLWGGVSWYAPKIHSLNKIDFTAYDSEKMIIRTTIITPATDSTAADTSIAKIINYGSSYSKTILDYPLSLCKLIIVQVYNNQSSGDGYHWVLVYGKENGQYLILDPGGRDEKYLSDYGDGEFWSYRIYQKN